ncbi:MAG: Zn-ribbon domain-containing OB-fold protein [Acidimicrobiales bacterium]
MPGYSVRRDDASGPFFDSAADGRLLVRRCPACGRWYPPQQVACADGTTAEWVDAAGTATLVTWGIDAAPPLDPQLGAADGSAVLALVELIEGPWMYAAIVGADPATLHEGAPLTVRFVRPGEGETIPVFAPA